MTTKNDPTSTHLEAFELSMRPDHTHGSLVDQFLQGRPLRCWLGLSPTTSFVNRSRLRSILKWLTTRSPSIMVVEGSYANRWNLMAKQNKSEAEAIQFVQEPVGRFYRRVQSIVAELDLPPISVLDWGKTMQSSKYQEIQAALRKYAIANPAFATAVLNCTLEYLDRTQRSDESNPDDIALWREYMFEELSMFLFLYENGCHVEVYPGRDLQIMQAIAAAEFSDFPIPCPERTHISIELTPI